MMKNIAEFCIIGRVGRITSIENATRLSVCANYRYKDGDTWRDDPHWNDIVVFSSKLRGTISRQIAVGDLIYAQGRIRQDRFEDRTTGEHRFSTNLVALDLGAFVASRVTDGD